MGVHQALRESVGDSMNLLYFIIGIITVALLVYLVVALLKPEWFA
jgi:K+-transporting ATPase KdpF subunit